MSNKEQPYVDRSEAPEGTTQVVMINLKEDGTPCDSRSWEKVVYGYVYEWRDGGWDYYVRECELSNERIKRPINTELTKQTFSVDVGDDEDLKKALDVIVANYQGKLLIWKDHVHEDEILKMTALLMYQKSFNDYVNDLITAFDRGHCLEVVDRNEQRKKEIQDQIEKLKEELDGL